MKNIFSKITKEQWKEIGYIALKSLIFTAVFAVLHYLYYLNNNPFFQAISGKDESVFQHLKMGAFGYLFLIGIDYLIIRKRIENKSSFVFSRLLSSLLVPWIIFVIWYLAPAIIGLPLSFGWELTWAMFVVFITGIIAAIIDRNTEKLEFNLSMKIVIIGLVVLSAFILIWFSFVDPWVDVFTLHEH
ncbi:MAG: hypothetical protein ACTSQF_03355 [Candidatus Heimdallarchaeaceae archaeon]